MRHSLGRLAVTLMIVLMTVAVLATGNALDAWHTTVATGERITFSYPTWLTADEVQWLIADREQAITFVEGFLDWEFQARIRFSVETSLVMSTGSAVPRPDGGYVIVRIPHSIDPHRVVPWAEILPGGCHEEVHVISAHMHHWSEETMRSSSRALLEGLATYINAIYRQAPVYRTYASGLLQQDALPPLDQFLALDLDFDSTQLDRFAIYHGGACFLEFLEDAFGRDTLLAVYAQAAHPTAELLSSVETLTGMHIEELDTRWREHIRAYTDDVGRRGVEILDLLTSSAVYRMASALSRVSETWTHFALEAIGPSEDVTNSYDVLQASLHELACNLDTAPLVTDHERCSEAIRDLSTLANLWGEAIEAYQAAIKPPFWADEEWVHDQLISALAGYRAVGDLIMVERVQALLSSTD